ncbi:MAG: UbiD family decarboxylase [Chloroflexi bacterium]|nr:UbiD family decarboxylase [Chloroflexota bacterium]
MAYLTNMREHLKMLEEKGKLVRVKSQINKDTELMPFVRLNFRGLPEEERKAFLFENVVDAKGRKYDIPVAVGIVAGSRDIYALSVGCSIEDLREKWADALRNQLKPNLVSTGPVHDVVIMGDDLLRDGNGVERIPIPISTPGFDNAPYTTATHWFSKDPETGIRNVGNYRSQLKAKDRLGIFVHPTQHVYVHWDKARKLGRKTLEAALVIGGPPSIAYTAVAKIPFGIDELAVSGALMGEPIDVVKCKTIDMEVPANAEIVIEGEMDTEYLEPEAPFGEFCGYMGDRVLNPYIKIKCITMRKDAIYHAITSQMPPSESSKIRQIAYEGVYYKFLKYDCNIPGLMNVAFHESAGGKNFIAIQMKKRNPAQPWQALNAAVALDPPTGKILVVVDEDIDPTDLESVIWAMSFRMQPHRDTRITMGKASMLDHSSAPPGTITHDSLAFPSVQGTSALLIDATCKWPYPPVSLPKREYMERALELWEAEGLPKLKLRAPWFGYELGYWSDEFAEEAELAVRGEYYKTGAKLAEQRQRVR